MKLQRGSWALYFATASLLAAAAGAAETAAPIQLRYTLPPGQTNAYNLTITQQGESGRETMTGTLLVSTRKEGAYLAISFKGQMRPKMTPGSPMMMGYRPGAPASLSTFLGYAYGPPAESREMVIDETGRVLRLRGDSALPIPLGSLLTSFLTQVPAEPTAGWEKDEYVYLLDEPLLAGPVIASQQSSGPMLYSPGRTAPATVTARQKTSVKLTGSTPETVTLKADGTIETLLPQFFRRDTPVAEALIKIGPPAEGAVLALLKQKHTDTRIIACSILKQIGTKKSLSVLKELTGNSVKELSEAAAEAARSIQGRE
ncbi:MAG: HEAT repeat domain-containing protein [Verrucomicrobia bacterium]|nr:HEAT repeat domain-containing protein [Verrucomicrobiota bacterium]